MGHVDHPEQAVGDRQAERREQQDRAQRQATEGLAEQVADQQPALDLGQAGGGGDAHAFLRFHRRVEQVLQAGSRQRIAGLAEQAHGGKA